MTDDLLRYRIAARLWQQQAEALYEEWAHADRLLRVYDPGQPKLDIDKISMIASIKRIIDQEVDAVTHLKDKG